MTIPDLIARIEAHEEESALIDAEMERLNLSEKDVKAIRKAKAASDAAKKTLDALMAAGLVPQ